MTEARRFAEVQDRRRTLLSMGITIGLYTLLFVTGILYGSWFRDGTCGGRTKTRTRGSPQGGGGGSQGGTEGEGCQSREDR
jgi:hypothetical protein